MQIVLGEMIEVLFVGLVTAVVGLLGSFGLYAIVRVLAGMPFSEKGSSDEHERE